MEMNKMKETQTLIFSQGNHKMFKQKKKSQGDKNMLIKIIISRVFPNKDETFIIYL